MTKIIHRSPSLEEMRIHGNAGFPFSLYHEQFHAFYKETADLHWHQEIEFQYVTKGVVYAQIDGQPCTISEGDGLFINANTLHMTKAYYKNTDTTYCSYLFLPELIGNPTGSVYINNILPVLDHPSMHFVHLRKEIAWQKKILDQLSYLASLNPEMQKNYYIYILSSICEIWKTLLNNTELPKIDPSYSLSESLARQRTAAMISYMHEHCGDNISIDALAKYAGISRSECFRNFHKFVGSKPIEYLNQYRLSKAAELLRNTDLSITDIFTQCGFNHQSYFGKLFQKEYQLSPSKYRKLYKIREPLP